MSERPGGSSPVESVDRALRLLELLSFGHRGMTLEELASGTALPRSSIHRLLGALRHRGFVTQPEPGGRYFVGPELLACAFRFHDGLDARVIAHPLLVAAGEEFNETVHLGSLEGDAVVYVDKIDAKHPVRLSSVVGGRNPAHCTGIGKALLAWTWPDDEALRSWFDEHAPLAAPTRRSHTDFRSLARDLAASRSRGYALDLEENELGVVCVAVPLFFGGSRPLAAVSVSAPKQRLPVARLHRIGAFLQTEARRLALEA